MLGHDFQKEAVDLEAISFDIQIVILLVITCAVPQVDPKNGWCRKSIPPFCLSIWGVDSRLCSGSDWLPVVEFMHVRPVSD